jgi:hypothetical protein
LKRATRNQGEIQYERHIYLKDEHIVHSVLKMKALLKSLYEGQLTYFHGVSNHQKTTILQLCQVFFSFGESAIIITLNNTSRLKVYRKTIPLPFWIIS